MIEQWTNGSDIRVQNYDSIIAHPRSTLSLSSAVQNGPVSKFEGNISNGIFYEGAYHSGPSYPQLAPCEGGTGPWSFNYCYGYFGDPPCPFTNVIDIEDFM